jgi:alpha-1,2-mannosyltransferase
MTTTPPAILYRERTEVDDWLPAALVAVVTAYAALTRPAPIRLSDLGVYVGAVDGLRHGASLYDFISAGNAPFTYPPFAGLLFWPLADAPTLPLQAGWTLLTMVTVGWLARLMVAAAGQGGSRITAPMLALVLFLSAPVSSDLRYGQVSMFLAALVAADVLLLRESRFHGVLIGIAAAIKLTPLIFIPMLWFAGRRRAAATAALTFAGCGLVGAVLLSGDSWRFWTVEVSQVSRLGYITSVGNQSLNGALLRLDLPPSLRTVIVLIVGGTIAAVALWRAARRARDDDWVAALIVTGAASIVLSPVSWTHHQIWLVLAVLLPVRTRGSRAAWIAVVVIVMVLPMTALGPPLWSNARLLLAIVTAAFLPLSAARPTSPSRSSGDRTAGRERQVPDDVPIRPTASGPG